MSASSEVRAHLDHPVVDIDGHTIEFFPALGRLPARGGRRPGEPVDAPAAARRLRARWPTGTRSRPRSAPRRRVARPPWWGAPARNTPRPRHRDVPGAALRAPRRARHRRQRHLPEPRARVPALRRRARAPRRVPGAQPLQRRGVRRARRPARARSPRSRCTRPTRRSTSSSTRCRRSASGRCCWPASCSARSRAVADVDPRARAVRGVDRHVRPRQRVRLRPGVGRSAASSASRVRSTRGSIGLGQPRVDLELHVQPRRHARRGPPRAVPSRCSSAASPAASPTSTSRSSRAASRGRRRSTPTSSATGRSATRDAHRPRSTPTDVDWDVFAELFAQLRQRRPAPTGVDAPRSARAERGPGDARRVGGRAAIERARGHPRPVRAAASSSAARPTTR